MGMEIKVTTMKTAFLICFGSAVLFSLSGSLKAGDLKQKYIGKNSCTPELRSSSERYGIRLDKTQRAYLNAYVLKDSTILAIVQHQGEHDQCGVIRDVVQAHDIGSSFVWNCVDLRIPADIVVGTWPANHKAVTGSTVEAWRIDLKELKFVAVKGTVNCRAGNYAGSDDGDGLSDWAKKRAAERQSK